MVPGALRAAAKPRRAAGTYLPLHAAGAAAGDRVVDDRDVPGHHVRHVLLGHVAANAVDAHLPAQVARQTRRAGDT